MGSTLTPIQLTQDRASLTVSDYIHRINDYITDPVQYLINTIGGAQYNENKHLMHLPDHTNNAEYNTLDVYGSGGHKQLFESHIAKLFSKRYCTFMITGVAAQTIACKLYCIQYKRDIAAWHHKSHLQIHEQNSYSELYNIHNILIGQCSTQIPSVNDIRSIIELPLEKRPSVIVMELPNRELGCVTYSYDELVEISELCHSNGIALHCDGARIWEIESYYKQYNNKSYSDIAALFDSIYISFYKGLHGVAGAMLLSNNQQFISDANVWVRRAGGNPITLIYDTIDCERGFNENIGTFDVKYKKMLSIARAVQESTQQYKLYNQRSIIQFEPTVPTCCQAMIHIYGANNEQLNSIRDTIQHKLNIRVFNRVRQYTSVNNEMNGVDDRIHYCQEWSVYSGNINIDNKCYVDAYTMLAEEISKLQ